MAYNQFYYKEHHIQWVVYINFFNYLEVASFQIHLNAYTILAALDILFHSLFKREPTMDEIKFLYIINSRSSTTSFFFSVASDLKVVEMLTSNMDLYQTQYFFVQDHSSCFHLFQQGRECHI